MTYNSDKRTLFPLLPSSLPQLVHGSFSRHGGVSEEPFTSNNVSFGIGDSQEGVLVNREKIKKKIGLKYMVSAHQVHGDKVFHVDSPVLADTEIEGYDALVTRTPGIGLLIQHADCQAVLLFDPANRVVAAIHNGWRGSVANIVATTVMELQLKYNTDPGRLVAAVGPSLGPCCSEFVNFRDELPPSFLPYQVSTNHFDFWQITTHQLLECGLREGAISIAGLCTSCSPDFYSYRRACRDGNGITGRNGTLVGLI